MAGRRDIQAGKAYVEMYIRNKGLIRGLRKAQERLRAFGAGLQSIGVKMLAMGTAMAAPFAFATRTFMGFEDQMLTVKAVTGAVGAEFDKLYAKAKLLGRTTSFMAAEVAGGMVQLGRAGFAPSEIDASVSGILNLARATGTELPRAAEIAAGTLRAFSLEADQMNRVTDVLTATAINSAQTLEQLGDSMVYVAPLADEYGLSLEETSRALGVMANMQIKGSMAGTGMRMMLLQLSDPKIRKQLKDMNIDLSDFGNTMVGVGQAMVKMSGPQRLDFAKQMFGQRAAGAAVKLARNDFPELSDAIDNAAGTAAKAAAMMDSGLGGAFRRLMSAVEGVKIAIGEDLGESLASVMVKVTKMAGTLTKFIHENKRLAFSILKITVGIIAASAAVVAIGVPFLVLSKIIGIVTSVVGAFSGAIGAPLVLGLGVLAAAVAAVAVVYANAKIQGITFGESVLDLTHKITGLTNAYSRLNAQMGNEAQFSKRGRGIEEGLKSGDTAHVEAGIKSLEARKAILEKRLVAMEERNYVVGLRYKGRLKKLDEYTGKQAKGSRLATGYRKAAAELELVTMQLKQFKEEQQEMKTGKLLARGPGVIADMAKMGMKAGKAFATSMADQFTSLIFRPLTHELNVAMAKGIADPQKREEKLAQLRHKTERADVQKQIKKGKAGPANLVMLEQIQQQELANIRGRYARQAAEKQAVTDRWLAEARKEHETQIADDIARLRIESTMKGAEKEKALMALRHRQERREASELGVDPKLLEQKFALERNMPKAAALTSAGTFSAAQSSMMGGGTQTVVKTLKEIRADNKKAYAEAKDVRRKTYNELRKRRKMVATA